MLNVQLIGLLRSEHRNYLAPVPKFAQIREPQNMKGLVEKLDPFLLSDSLRYQALPISSALPEFIPVIQKISNRLKARWIQSL
jgi:hypothetical protein